MQNKNKSFLPLFSLTLVLILALGYFVLDQFSPIKISNTQATASVILAQNNLPTGSGGGSVNNLPAGTGGTFANPLGNQTTNLQAFLYALLDKVVIPLGAIVVTFSIILAGYKFVASQGDTKAIEAARKQLTWTAIGAAILLGAKVLTMVITNTVNTLTS